MEVFMHFDTSAHVIAYMFEQGLRACLCAHDYQIICRDRQKKKRSLLWLSKEVLKSNFRQYGQMEKQRWAESEKGRDEKKREDQRKERARRKKVQLREKGEKSRFTMFFQKNVALEGRKVGSLKRRVRSHLAKWEMKNCTPFWREAYFEVKSVKNLQVRTTFGRSTAPLDTTTTATTTTTTTTTTNPTPTPTPSSTITTAPTTTTTTTTNNYTTLQLQLQLQLHYTPLHHTSPHFPTTLQLQLQHAATTTTNTATTTTTTFKTTTTSTTATTTLQYNNKCNCNCK